jgi:hypothetical protein
MLFVTISHTEQSEAPETVTIAVVTKFTEGRYWWEWATFGKRNAGFVNFANLDFSNLG